MRLGGFPGSTFGFSAGFSGGLSCVANDDCDDTLCIDCDSADSGTKEGRGDILLTGNEKT